MSDQDLQEADRQLHDWIHESMSASCAAFRFRAESEPEVLSLS